MRLPGELTEATVNGQPVTVADIPTNRRQRFTLLYFGLPPQGAEVRLTIRGHRTHQRTLVDYSNDLPKLPGMTAAKASRVRPGTFRLPRPHGVTRSVDLP